MVCYIYLKIDGRELLVNEDDSYDIKMISTSSLRPRWNQLTIGTHTKGYKSIKINQKQKRLHRVIYYAHNQEWDISDVSKNNFIDHIDGNKANNDIRNLRVVTSQQNSFNTRAKGISWNKCAKKWAAQIYLNRKKIHLGYFDTEEEARNAYLEAKKKYHIMPQLVLKSEKK